MGTDFIFFIGQVAINALEGQVDWVFTPTNILAHIQTIRRSF